MIDRIEAFTLIDWFLLGLVYFAGVLMSIAAFGKTDSMTGRYVDNEEKAWAIGLSLFFWPICLILLTCSFMYRKSFRK